MKITWKEDGVEMTDTVDSEIGGWFRTSLGYTVSRDSVLRYSNRGGSTAGAGRKSNSVKGVPSKVQMYFYNTEEVKKALTEEARLLGMTFSQYINHKLGI